MLILGIIRKETVGCSMLVDEVFKSAWHVGCEAHGVDHSSGAGLLGKELSNSSTNMTKEDANFMGRSIAKEFVSCSIFVPRVNIASRKF
jgi:hypothetical protein